MLDLMRKHAKNWIMKTLLGDYHHRLYLLFRQQKRQGNG